MIASHAPATTGTYWYVSDRSWEPTVAINRKIAASDLKNLKKVKNPKERGALKDLEQFGAIYAATEESWTGQSRARTIVNENLAFSFTSAAGEASSWTWQPSGTRSLGLPG